MYISRSIVRLLEILPTSDVPVVASVQQAKRK